MKHQKNPPKFLCFLLPFGKRRPLWCAATVSETLPSVSETSPCFGQGLKLAKCVTGSYVMVPPPKYGELRGGFFLGPKTGLPGGVKNPRGKPLGSTNVAVAGKWGPRIEERCMDPIENGDVIPAIAM